MLIKVVDWQWNSISENDDKVDFYLESDNWNDYNFYTSYYLHLSSKHTKDSEHALIGGVKILKKGQAKGDYNLIGLGYLEVLPNDFCSLGQSLDYYQRISELYPHTKDYILTALNDVIYNDEIKQEFRYEEGFVDSLMRYVGEESDIFNLGPSIIRQNFDSIPELHVLNFDFKTSEMEKFVSFNFKSNHIVDENEVEFSLSSRIIAVIGKNGSGKTTFLSKLSKLAFASTTDRIEKLGQIAQIRPAGIGFPRIISVSYSAFDTFKVPGIRVKEVEQISKEIVNGDGRYIYCGIRNITQELTDFLKEIREEKGGYLTEEDILKPNYKINILKSSIDITKEFHDSLNVIEQDESRKDLLHSIIKILATESSFAEVFNVNISDINIEIFKEAFNDLSTGHKFILHSLLSIIKNIEKNSLVLFDEPEIHLHPPLLSILMKSLRYILEKRYSFMIVTTHSPIVVQEILSSHVYIIKRVGSSIGLLKPEIQTYGENVSIITSHVFGLNSDIVDFYDDLDMIVEIYKKQDGTIDEKMQNISQLFNGNISIQTRAYLMTKLAEDYI
jgi:predicted ATPase